MEKAIAHGIENFKDYLGAMGFMPKPLLAFFNGESILMQFHKPVPEILDLSWKSFSLQSNELTKAKLVEHKPKVIIRPSIDDVGMFDFYKYKKCIRKGELATKRHIGEIKVLSQMQ